jgi:hypothetical protein|tara:strand:+ start:7857 stop:8615 length:759 start_codon:yes stop_codon:yes gene_type:complete
MLSVAVEGKLDETIVRAILTKAEVNDFEIIVQNGSLALGSKGRSFLPQLSRDKPMIVLFDQESGSIGDAVAENEGHSNIIYCPAIPNADAWLFADSTAFFEVLGDKAEAFVGRLPLPEQLPYPKFLRSTMLRDPEVMQRLLQRISLLIAGSRSPSFKYFVQSARKLSGMAPVPFDQPSNHAGQLNREVLRNLISEIYPSEKTLFRSASGETISAERMMQEVTDGSDLGREYSSDILRVARDLLARQANKKVC